MKIYLSSEYWKKMVDMIPEFGRFQNLVNSILADDVTVVGTRKIHNLEIITEYTDTASQRFKHILFALDNLKEIEKDLPVQMGFDEEYEIDFKAEYHFFAFINSVSSFLNSMAWLIKYVYDIKVKRRQHVDLRKNKPLLEKLKTKNPELYEFTLKNLDKWIEEVLLFRDILLHRHEIKLIGASDGKLRMPIHPEIVSYTDIDFESEENHERRMNKIRWKKGNITQHMIPFCENAFENVVNFSKVVCKSLLNKII